MPLVNLIFFPEPVERTEAQIEEARLLGHIREPGTDETPPQATTASPAGEPSDDTNDEAGEPGHDPEEIA